MNFTILKMNKAKETENDAAYLVKRHTIEGHYKSSGNKPQNEIAPRSLLNYDMVSVHTWRL